MPLIFFAAVRYTLSPLSRIAALNCSLIVYFFPASDSYTARFTRLLTVLAWPRSALLRPESPQHPILPAISRSVKPSE